jgi:hypothetical protein
MSKTKLKTDSEANIFFDYFNQTKNFCNQYGTRTILLMQVGAFFEVYGLKNAETGVITHSQIVDFSQICQLNVSEKKNYINNKKSQIQKFIYFHSTIYL